MSRNSLPSKLLDRELGQDFDFLNLDEQPWSLPVSSKQLSQELQFSNPSRIFSIQYRENFLVVITKNSECFIWNTFNRTIWKRILSENYQVFKVTILDNNSFFLVSKRIRSQRLEFFKFRLPFDNCQGSQMLTHLNVMYEDFQDCDIYLNRLVFCVQGSFQVYDIVSMDLLFQSTTTHWYSRNHVALITPQSETSEVFFYDLGSQVESVFAVNNRFRVKLIESFKDFFVFSNNNSLCFGNFSNFETGIICPTPSAYFIGLNASAAVFENYMVLINSKWNRVDLVPKAFCADKVGILVIYEKFNMNLVVLKDDGVVLNTIPIDAKVVYITVNIETSELAVACKNIVQIFE